MLMTRVFRSKKHIVIFNVMPNKSLNTKFYFDIKISIFLLNIITSFLQLNMRAKVKRGYYI